MTAARSGTLFQYRIADGVATVTMDNPPVNAMSDAWVAGFHALLDTLTARDDWSVLHLRSALRIFCAGAELKEMQERFDAPDGVSRQMAVIEGYQALLARIEALPRVTLAEIGGAALGGGLELALACDLRIAGHAATLGLPEVGLGLLPGAGGTQRLTRLCGAGVATRLILAAETVKGEAAERLGLVQWSVPAADLEVTAANTSRRYAALPGHAVAAAKRCIAIARDGTGDGFRAELTEVEALLYTERTRELIRAFLSRAAR